MKNTVIQLSPLLPRKVGVLLLCLKMKRAIEKRKEVSDILENMLCVPQNRSIVINKLNEFIFLGSIMLHALLYYEYITSLCSILVTSRYT